MTSSATQIHDKSQSDKFRDAALELECDESESHWDERLKKVVAHKPRVEPKPE